MNYFRTAALAATAGLALMATSVSANTSPCEFRASEEFPIGNPAGVAITNSQAMEQLISSPRGQSLLASSPAECRGFVISESMRISGLMPAAPLVPNVKMRIAIPTRFTAPQPVVFAPQPLPPANTGTASPGGGAMLDAEIAELRRQRASGEASPEVLARLAALEARPASAGPDLRPQISRLERQYAGLQSRPAATLNASDSRLLQQLPGQIAAMREAQTATETAEKKAAESATTANGAATTATTASAAAQQHQTAAEDAANRSETAASKLTGWLPWVWWTLLPLLLVGLLIWMLARSGMAKKTDHDDTKADATTVTDLSTRIDGLDARLTDTEHQVGKKVVALESNLDAKLARMKEGDEVTTPVVVDGVVYEVGLRKGVGREAFITSGVKGHTVSNAVKDLAAALSNAAWSGRLTKTVDI